MTLAVAHRGAAQEAPQNSVQAFLAARAQGADGVELDVRRSRDGALVINHDAQIAGLGPISALDLATLPEHVALLSEAMAAADGMLVNVEIKNSADEPGHDPTGSLVAQVLTELAEIRHDGGVLISSFDLATVEAVHRADPSMPVGLLLDLGADLESAVDLAASSGFSAVHPFVMGCTADGVRRAHEQGIAVNVWTVNAAHDVTALLDMGVDAIITDDVPMVRGVMDARG